MERLLQCQCVENEGNKDIKVLTLHCMPKRGMQAHAQYVAIDVTIYERFIWQVPKLANCDYVLKGLGFSQRFTVRFFFSNVAPNQERKGKHNAAADYGNKKSTGAQY